MKKFAILLILTSFSSLAFAQGSFTVQGKFKNYEGKVYLLYGGERDSVLTNGGKFLFSGKVKIPQEAAIQVATTQLRIGVTPFWIDKGKTILEMDTSSFKTSRFNGLDVKGKIILAGATHNFIDSVTNLLNKVWHERTNEEEAKKKIKAIVDHVLIQKPRSMISLYFLSTKMKDYKDDYINKFYISLDPELQKTNEGLKLKNIGIKPIEIIVGNEMPNFTQNSQFGKPISLEDFKGKYILIDFWASWCIPCRRENPAVVLAYQKYKDKGFDILAVSLDSNKERWNKAIKDDGLIWSHVSDLGGWENVVSKKFSIKSVPSNILIDKNGVVIAKDLFGIDLQNKLAEIFTSK